MSDLQLSWIPVVGNINSGTLIESDTPFSITVYYPDGDTVHIEACSCDGVQYAAVMDVPVKAVACLEVRAPHDRRSHPAVGHNPLRYSSN
jgi:hypothetical protein